MFFAIILLSVAASCQAQEGRFFNTVTVTVATTTPTKTSTPTCWTTTADVTDTPCSEIRRRNAVWEVDDEEELSDVAEFHRQERQVTYGYFYPESTLLARTPSARAGGVPDPANRWLLSFITATAPTVTVLFSSKVTTIVTCAGPSKITAC